MELFVIVLSALLLSGYSRGGPTALSPRSGTCWVMGNLHYTFDQSYYTFTGNCTYIMAKNCHVDAALPAFEVDIKNINADSSIPVPSVGTISLSVYGFYIQIVQSEFGLVRVNYQPWNLPINLNNGQLKFYQKGLFVVAEADFGLRVQYDWIQYLAITVPGSFAGSVCGLCGNFNSKKEDDLTTPSGSVASSVAALGASWKVPAATNDAYCQDECGSQCANCTLGVEKQSVCSTLIQNYAELLGCQLNIDEIQTNCVINLCRGEAMTTYLCNSLQGYAHICQMSGAQSIDWRASAQCPMPNCPANSHYEFCGSPCPATCANRNTTCSSNCVEACVCNDGFILGGSQCVPEAQCGCMYEGRYVEAETSFWGDETCTKTYTCSPGGGLSVSQTGCPSGQRCQVVAGLQGCYPLSYGTCMVSGDPHFVTFDGQRFNFQGTCIYEMAGVASNQTSLEHFSVVLQSSGQDMRIGSVVRLVEVVVYGYNFTISKQYPGAVVVNGELSNLPMTLDNNKVHLYTSGWFAVIEMDFGAKVYYDWSSVAFVIVPSTYAGAMQGLCGNYNLNLTDDMQMRDGRQASTSEELGRSWKLASVPGCVDGCSSPCPGCNSTQTTLYNTSSYCGLISDPAGPFRDCHSTIDPTGFLNDCVYDVCLYQGSGSMQCKTLTAYTAACQLQGITVYPWRSAQFCAAQCPSNSHYDLCTSSCLGSCENNSTVSNCGAQCMEGCPCDEGYLLSGDECVPANQCGCMYEGVYYQQGQIFYPDANCQMKCTCSNGTVQCQQSSCGPYEVCGLKNSVRSCQPVGQGVCSISGDPHYNTFDNSTYNFQGTCTYVAAEGCNLNGTQLTGFSVVVENEPWYDLSGDPQVSVAKLVAVEVYGLVLILRRNDVNMVWVNGVLHHLPQSLLNGAVTVSQEGSNDVILTDFGLRVTYDLVYHVTVTVPGSYRGKTCGLCGNFNNNQPDEFQLPDGSVTKNIQTFGAAWKVPVPGVVCQDGCSGDLCPTCSASAKAAIETKCAFITNPTGPFAACHDVLDPTSYYNDCVYDVCMAKDEQSMLCKSIAAFVLDCQYSGAQVLNWRSSSFCPYACSNNSHYETCMMPCDSPCPGLRNTMTCTSTCVEGCVCDNGFYYNGTGCVPSDQCSCYYNGHTYKIGQTVITDNCQRINTCQASGVIVSTNTTCNPDEICQVRNGVMGCYLQRCSLTSNGSLSTFSGEYGTIAAPGGYEMIQNCNPSASDWFRVVASLQRCNPGFNTLLAYYVFFNDMMIAVTNKHGVWIDGREMTQTNFSQNNVLIEVSDGTVRISSSSSIQLSFTPANELIMTVSDEVADTICGACGKLESFTTETAGLRQNLLVKLHEIPFSLSSLDVGQWTGPDFPVCE